MTVYDFRISEIASESFFVCVRKQNLSRLKPHILDQDGRLFADAGVVVVDDQAVGLDFLEGRLRDEIVAQTLVLVRELLDGHLQVLDALEDAVHLHLRHDFVACLVDVLAVLPVHLRAAQHLDPVEDGVLDVAQEVQVRLVHASAWLVVVEHALSHRQLVPVLVETRQENGHEPDDDAEQSACIR